MLGRQSMGNPHPGWTGWSPTFRTRRLALSSQRLGIFCLGLCWQLDLLRVLPLAGWRGLFGLSPLPILLLLLLTSSSLKQAMCFWQKTSTLFHWSRIHMPSSFKTIRAVCQPCTLPRCSWKATARSEFHSSGLVRKGELTSFCFWAKDWLFSPTFGIMTQVFLHRPESPFSYLKIMLP